MIGFTRPAKPRGFDEHVAAAKQAIADLVAKGIRPKSDDFEDRWGRYKPYFIEAQHRKCAFCESMVTQVDTGDVEHYRPKACVTALPSDRSKWGRELPNSGNAEGRSPDLVCQQGYHFLAYDWDNYLFCCGRCNRAWKGNLFPLISSSEVADPTPESAATEAPLLLNPYQEPDPTQHLQLLRAVPGQIIPRADSPFGRATIDTCHLDRESLVESRYEKAAALFRDLEELSREAEPPYTAVERALLRVREMGSKKHPYAGLVRATFEERLGMRWEEAFPEEVYSGSQPTGSSG